MATTITREQLLEKAKPRYEEVEVEGIGVVGIRSLSELRQSHRATQMFDDNGNMIKEKWSLRRAYQIIDQVMVDENTPMFSSSDIDEVAGMELVITQALVDAINKFNGDEVAEKKGDL